MDLDMCEGLNCPLKNRCYRYTAPKDYKYQSYMIGSPFRKEKGKIVCDLFIKDKRKLKNKK